MKKRRRCHPGAASRRRSLTARAARPAVSSRTRESPSACCSVRPISSRPFSRQCLRNGSTSNAKTARRRSSTTTCRSRSMMSLKPGKAAIGEQPIDLRLRQHDRQQAVLEAVVVEDVGVRRRDHRAEAVVGERPRRVLARAAAAEVAAREQDRRALVARLVQHEVGIERPLRSCPCPARRDRGSATRRTGWGRSPMRLIDFRNCFGMIASVSTLARSSGATRPVWRRKGCMARSLNGCDAYLGLEEPRPFRWPSPWPSRPCRRPRSVLQRRGRGEADDRKQRCASELSFVALDRALATEAIRRLDARRRSGPPPRPPPPSPG